jgi:hypothetical protein
MIDGVSDCTVRLSVTVEFCKSGYRKSSGRVGLAATPLVGGITAQRWQSSKWLSRSAINAEPYPQKSCASKPAT